MGRVCRNNKSRRINMTKEQIVPKWFNGQIYDKGGVVANRFTGEEIELNNIELSMYDFVMGASITAKTQLANGSDILLAAGTHYMTPADGNAITVTMPTYANSSLGDVIIIEYHVLGSNGQTMKIGTASQFYMAKSAIYKPVGATGSLVGLNFAVDLADGSADDFANLVGLTNAGPGVGSYAIITFNGSVWRFEARLESSGTSVVNGTSVFAQS